MTRKKIFNKNILIIALCAFLGVLGAFRSVSAPRAFADEQTRDNQFFYLADLQINYAYKPVFTDVLKFSDVMTYGQGNKWISTKTINTATTAFQDITFKNFFNQLSGTGGELIRFTRESKIEFDVDAEEYGTDLVAVLDFYDSVNSTYNYIIQFFNAKNVNSINFSDILINGYHFPTNQNDTNFNRYKFNGLQLFYISAPSGWRDVQIMPVFSTFNQRVSSSAYASRDTAFFLIANANIYNYNENSADNFKFDVIFAQISQISYGSSTALTIQQNTLYSETNNLYWIDYTPQTVDNEYYVYNASAGANLIVGTDGKLYSFTSDPDDAQELLESSYTNFRALVSDSADDYLKIYASTAGGASPLNVVTTGATNADIVTDFIESFKFKLKFNTYTPAPEPEPEPEPEPTPEPSAWEQYTNDLNNLITAYSEKWTPITIIATGAFGVGGLVAAGFGWLCNAFFDMGGFVTLADAIGEEMGLDMSSPIEKIGKFIGQSTKYIIETLGTLFRAFLDGLGIMEPLQKFGSIALMIFGIVATAGLFGYLFIIKRR